MHLNGFSRNVGEFADKLLNWLIQIANKYFPIKKKTMTDKRLVAPWITPRIMRCINKKHLWLKLLKRGIIYYSSFKSYCIALNKLLSSAEKNYYNRKFDKLSRDPKKNWKLLNGLLGKHIDAGGNQTKFLIDGVSSNDSGQISNAFSNYFAFKPRQLHMGIVGTINNYLNLVPFINSSFAFYHSTSNEVANIIRSLKRTGNIHDVPPGYLSLGLNISLL